MTLNEFEQLLHIYGADRTRWPLSARAGAVTLLASDRGAQRLLDEAAALDAVLSHVAEPDVAVTATLVDRIIAVSQRSPRLVCRTEHPGQLPGSARSANIGRRSHDTDLWRGIAALAASLVIGIFAGQSQFAAGAVPALEALAGISLPGSADRLAMADIQLEAENED